MKEIPLAWTLAGRVFLLVLATLSITWCVFIFPTTTPTVRLKLLASRVLASDLFRDSILEAVRPLGQAAENSSWCQPDQIRGAAIIRLRDYEDAIASAQLEGSSKALIELRASLDKALSCVPTDAFLWFVRFWANNVQGGFSESQLASLNMSYKYGPHEGWIGLKRNSYALAIFEQLPSPLAEQVVAEFANLLEAGFISEVAENLKGPGWPIREILLQRLAKTRIENRIRLARLLSADGIWVEIPGVTNDPRPWR